MPLLLPCKQNILDQVNRKFVFEKFDKARLKTCASSENNPKQYVFDDCCQLCYQSFSEQAEVIVTTCKHTFHRQCLQIWTDNEALRIARIHKAKGMKTLLEEDGMACPNCDHWLLKDNSEGNASSPKEAIMSFEEQKEIALASEGLSLALDNVIDPNDDFNQQVHIEQISISLSSTSSKMVDDSDESDADQPTHRVQGMSFKRPEIQSRRLEE